MEAIKLSSTVFYRELKGKPFATLDAKLRIKLRKYLLRGRFRPTPFGMFAGVGIGKWGTELNLNFPLRTELIGNKTDIKSPEFPDSEINQMDRTYRLLPGIHKKLGYYHALVFDNKSNQWKGCKLPINNLFENLILYTSEQPIDFNGFQKLLNPEDSNKDSREDKNLWQQILETGFLTPQYGFESHNTGRDVVMQNHLEISKTTKEQLQQFVDSAGDLFAKEESNYLRDFKRWFSAHFDDRYLNLQRLLAHSDFLSGQFLQDETYNEKGIESLIAGHQPYHSLDLQDLVSKKQPDKGVYDLQILFRLDSLGNPVIENMVCNRPFVYTGRFNRHPAIEIHSQEIKKRIHTDNEIIYAHLALTESESKGHIYHVSNIFAYEITPFVPQSPKQLGFDELYLGISSDQIRLYHKPSGKRVIPVVLHPLNGEQITHPILRLLWEAAHQDRFRFMPYQSQTLNKATHSPQLNWGKICLQSRRWRLDKEKIPGITELVKKLNDLGVPRHILAGHGDRELLLNRYIKEDIQILWQELKRSSPLTVSDPSWFPSGIFRSSDGTAAYPQFVFHYSRPRHTTTSKAEFNPIDKMQDNCLCFTLTLDDSDVPEVLEYLFQHLEKHEINSKIPCWFFLVYGKVRAVEIRLRLLEIAPTEKSLLLTSFSDLFSKEGLDWKTVSYYPENSKYGTKHLKISHRLFHMESKFLASKTRQIPHIHFSSSDKEELVVSLWKLIFSQSPNFQRLFDELKGEVKSMSHAEVSPFKSTFTYVSKNVKIKFPVTAYLTAIRSHEYFETPGTIGILFLMNHLHMMFNRFFPQQTHHHERRIRYRLYRELGKQLYSKPR